MSRDNCDACVPRPGVNYDVRDVGVDRWDRIARLYSFKNVFPFLLLGNSLRRWPDGLGAVDEGIPARACWLPRDLPPCTEATERHLRLLSTRPSSLPGRLPVSSTERRRRQMAQEVESPGK